MVDWSLGVPTGLLVQGLRKFGAGAGLVEPLLGSSGQGRDGPCSASCPECSVATSEERAGFSARRALGGDAEGPQASWSESQRTQALVLVLLFSGWVT